jgi:GPH family glycoside/pentoside/hexuronide:cation symporter
MSAAASRSATQRSHSWVVIWAFAFVGLPLATISLPLAIYLAPFYSGEVGLPLAALGTAMLLGRILDFAVDPFIGYASDRMRTPWGRRKPFVLVGALVLLLATHFLFRPAAGVGMTYFLAWLAVLYVGNSLISVPHRAWGAELSPHYDERTHISSVRQTFATAGLIASTVVPALVLGQPGAKSADVLASLSSLMWVLLPIAVLTGLMLTPDKQSQLRPTEPFSLSESWRALRRNGPLRVILLVLLIGFAAETFRQTMTVFYARDVIGVKNLGMVYVYFFVAAFVGLPFWRRLARWSGKHRALAGGIALSIIANLLQYTLGHGDALAFTLLFVIKGFCFGAMEMVPSAMLADATDVDTALSHKERAGLMFAMAGVVVNVGQALGQFLSLIALSWVGYRAAGETDPGALQSIRVLYALVPSLVMVLTLVMALRYRLTANRHARLREALARRKKLVRPAIQAEELAPRVGA